MPNTAKGAPSYKELENNQNPYQVECPRCKAPVDSKCRTKTGWPSALHSSRWKAVGIDSPSFGESRHADRYIKKVEANRFRNSQLENQHRRQEMERQRKNGFAPWDKWPIGAKAMVVNGGIWRRVESGWTRREGEILPQPTDQISHIEDPAGIVLV